MSWQPWPKSGNPRERHEAPAPSIPRRGANRIDPSRGPQFPPGYRQLTEPTPAVAIFIYRRPLLVRGLLDRLRVARPKKIWIIADGPSTGRGAEEEALCREARQEAEQGVTWPCTVQKVYAESNLGIRQRIETGLDEVFRHETEAIILEEDCHPGPDFFPFCEEMLARYRDQPQIAGISGNCYLPEEAVLESSYFYTRYLHIWGWATWARVWRDYDRSVLFWGRNGFRSYFPESRADEQRYWNRIFQRVAGGKIETWDYPLLAFLWSRGLLAVNPAQNLVENLGIGAGATHTTDRETDPGWGRQQRLPRPFVCPPGIRAQSELDRMTFQNHYLRMSGHRSPWDKLVFRFGEAAGWIPWKKSNCSK